MNWVLRTILCIYNQKRIGSLQSSNWFAVEPYKELQLEGTLENEWVLSVEKQMHPRSKNTENSYKFDFINLSLRNSTFVRLSWRHRTMNTLSSSMTGGTNSSSEESIVDSRSCSPNKTPWTNWRYLQKYKIKTTTLPFPQEKDRSSCFEHDQIKSLAQSVDCLLDVLSFVPLLDLDNKWWFVTSHLFRYSQHCKCFQEVE